MGKINENLINELKQKEQEKISATITKVQNGEPVLLEDLNLITTPVIPEEVFNKFGHVIPERWLEWLTCLSGDVKNELLPIESKIIEHSAVWADLKFASASIEENRKYIGDIEVSGTLWSNNGKMKPISLQNGQIDLAINLLNEIVANAIPCTIATPRQTREDRDYPSNNSEQRAIDEERRNVWHRGM